MSRESEDQTAPYDYSQLRAQGQDVFISPRVEIKRPALVELGSHIAIDSGFYCTTAVTMGDYVHIGPYVTVIGGAKSTLRMEGFNTVGAGSRILCASDEFLGHGLVGMSPPEFRDRVNYAPVIFRRFASIGTNVVVHPGVTLGEGSVVGSCSLVLRSTEPWSIYFGVPARKVRERPRDRMLQAARAMGYEE
ncbi:MAG: acyltransferase [Myxococcales bacterium]|nr:acyltransferase [Myxococcales bacterium]